MMKTLARILLALVTTTGLAAAMALGFDESGVDYSNQDMSTLYIGLSHADQGLQVILSDSRAAGTVATMDVDGKLTAFDDGWFSDGTIVKYLGNHCWAAKAFPDLVMLKHASLRLTGDYTTIRFEHNQPTPTVSGAYLNRLAELGYTVSEQPITSNITVYLASQGDETIRMVVERRGSSTTRVTLAPA